MQDYGERPPFRKLSISRVSSLERQAGEKKNVMSAIRVTVLTLIFVANSFAL